MNIHITIERLEIEIEDSQQGADAMPDGWLRGFVKLGQVEPTVTVTLAQAPPVPEPAPPTAATPDAFPPEDVPDPGTAKPAPSKPAKSNGNGGKPAPAAKTGRGPANDAPEIDYADRETPTEEPSPVAPNTDAEPTPDDIAAVEVLPLDIADDLPPLDEDDEEDDDEEISPCGRNDRPVVVTDLTPREQPWDGKGVYIGNEDRNGVLDQWMEYREKSGSDVQNGVSIYSGDLSNYRRGKKKAGEVVLRRLANFFRAGSIEQFLAGPPSETPPAREHVKKGGSPEPGRYAVGVAS
jgi:hypothetical protein